MNTPATHTVKSAMRAIDLLELVGGSAQPLSFGEIGEILKIPRSSLFYLLATLCRREYLEQRADRSYQLGRKAAGLSRPTIRDLAEIAVQRVNEATGTTTSYMELRGHEVEIVISRPGSGRLLPVHIIGDRGPLHVFSGGKIFLAAMSPEELEAYLAKAPLKRFTQNTITARRKLLAEIESVRAAGIGMSREEYNLGIIGVSVGLYVDGRVTGTLGISLPAAYNTDDRIMKVRQALTESAEAFAASTKLAGLGFNEN